MKRFYDTAAVVAEDDGYIITLDGKEVKTPEKRKNLSPTHALAAAICAEWDEQTNEINPASMLIAKLQNTAIDRVETRRTDLIDELVNYAATDLLCYRADFPDDLAARQDQSWQPLLEWLRDHHDITLKVTTGIIHIAQDQQQLEKIRQILSDIDSFRLAAFYNITTLCGSVSIGLNVYGGNITADQAWEAAQLDETYQIEQWGMDEEAKLRQENMKAELKAAVRFLELCHTP